MALGVSPDHLKSKLDTLNGLFPFTETAHKAKNLELELQNGKKPINDRLSAGFQLNDLIQKSHDDGKQLREEYSGKAGSEALLAYFEDFLEGLSGSFSQGMKELEKQLGETKSTDSEQVGIAREALQEWRQSPWIQSLGKSICFHDPSNFSDFGSLAVQRSLIIGEIDNPAIREQVAKLLQHSYQPESHREFTEGAARSLVDHQLFNPHSPSHVEDLTGYLQDTSFIRALSPLIRAEVDQVFRGLFPEKEFGSAEKKDQHNSLEKTERQSQTLKEEEQELLSRPEMRFYRRFQEKSGSEEYPELPAAEDFQAEHFEAWIPVLATEFMEEVDEFFENFSIPKRLDWVRDFDTENYFRQQFRVFEDQPLVLRRMILRGAPRLIMTAKGEAGAGVAGLQRRHSEYFAEVALLKHSTPACLWHELNHSYPQSNALRAMVLAEGANEWLTQLQSFDGSQMNLAYPQLVLMAGVIHLISPDAFREAYATGDLKDLESELKASCNIDDPKPLLDGKMDIKTFLGELKGKFDFDQALQVDSLLDIRQRIILGYYMLRHELISSETAQAIVERAEKEGVAEMEDSGVRKCLNQLKRLLEGSKWLIEVSETLQSLVKEGGGRLLQLITFLMTPLLALWSYLLKLLPLLEPIGEFLSRVFSPKSSMDLSDFLGKDRSDPGKNKLPTDHFAQQAISSQDQIRSVETQKMEIMRSIADQAQLLQMGMRKQLKSLQGKGRHSEQEALLEYVTALASLPVNLVDLLPPSQGKTLLIKLLAKDKMSPSEKGNMIEKWPEIREQLNDLALEQQRNIKLLSRYMPPEGERILEDMAAAGYRCGQINAFGKGVWGMFYHPLKDCLDIRELSYPYQRHEELEGIPGSFSSIYPISESVAGKMGELTQEEALLFKKDECWWIKKLSQPEFASWKVVERPSEIIVKKDVYGKKYCMYRLQGRCFTFSLEEDGAPIQDLGPIEEVQYSDSMWPNVIVDGLYTYPSGHEHHGEPKKASFLKDVQNGTSKEYYHLNDTSHHLTMVTADGWIHYAPLGEEMQRCVRIPQKFVRLLSVDFLERGEESYIVFKTIQRGKRIGLLVDVRAGTIEALEGTKLYTHQSPEGDLLLSLIQDDLHGLRENSLLVRNLSNPSQMHPHLSNGKAIPAGVISPRRSEITYRYDGKYYLLSGSTPTETLELTDQKNFDYAHASSYGDHDRFLLIRTDQSYFIDLDHLEAGLIPLSTPRSPDTHGGALDEQTKRNYHYQISQGKYASYQFDSSPVEGGGVLRTISKSLESQSYRLLQAPLQLKTGEFIILYRDEQTGKCLVRNLNSQEEPRTFARGRYDSRDFDSDLAGLDPLGRDWVFDRKRSTFHIFSTGGFHYRIALDGKRSEKHNDKMAYFSCHEGKVFVELRDPANVFRDVTFGGTQDGLREAQRETRLKVDEPRLRQVAKELEERLVQYRVMETPENVEESSIPFDGTDLLARVNRCLSARGNRARGSLESVIEIQGGAVMKRSVMRPGADWDQLRPHQEGDDVRFLVEKTGELYTKIMYPPAQKQADLLVEFSTCEDNPDAFAEQIARTFKLLKETMRIGKRDGNYRIKRVVITYEGQVIMTIPNSKLNQHSPSTNARRLIQQLERVFSTQTVKNPGQPPSYRLEVPGMEKSVVLSANGRIRRGRKALEHWRANSESTQDETSSHSRESFIFDAQAISEGLQPSRADLITIGCSPQALKDMGQWNNILKAKRMIIVS
jgi:hypothetical protein